MQLQHVQKMEAIGTIAAGVAHNFRNTLTEVLVNSQLVQMNFENENGLHEVAERINSAVKRGARLVEGLLQFSRKQIKTEFKPFDLTRLVQETSQLIRESFEQKIEIETDLPESLIVFGDNSGLGQALMNLCTNARDAMPDGGKLTIMAREQGDRAIITVSDTGIGMARETLDKCFDPFFTSKSMGKGTGLGLSTTYGIIKSHEGTIHVDSKPDVGTVFQIHLPVDSGIAVNHEEEVPQIIHGDGQRILVVDDEPEIIKALQDLLVTLGYNTEFAYNGKEGLEKYKNLKPDAVLMDINMPKMDGINCIEEIVNSDPQARISIISGYEINIADELSERTRTNVKGYLVKPVALPELSTLLAEMLKE
jgi:CheY-like chemotaxis protein